MDLSQLSDDDLKAVASGDMTKVSDDGLKFLSSVDPAKEMVIENRPKNGYEGVPDEQLSWYQKAERGAEKLGLVKPGEEMFSPNHIGETKKIAAAYAPLATGLYSVAAPGAMGSVPQAVAGAVETAAPAVGRGLLNAGKYVAEQAAPYAKLGVAYKLAKQLGLLR